MMGVEKGWASRWSVETNINNFSRTLNNESKAIKYTNN